ncbi:hypothetical protein ACP70R_044874 [Stipagrostis hirtigluma subsp. patula]
MAGLSTGAPIVQVYHDKSRILPDVSRVLACLYEKDVNFQTHHTSTYKSLLRLQASSHAPVPFYDGPTFLEESREICHYIAEKYEHQGYPFLLGKDALERASVEQWLHNEEHAFNPPSRALFCHLAFPLDEEDDGDDIDMHTRKLEEVLEVYEQRLSDSEFLAGNKFTLADLVHLPNSHYITASDKFLYLYDSRKNVRRWWDSISTRDSWQQVLRVMKRVEEQNKQEELKKQQQQQQKKHRTTSRHPIRIDSQKLVVTEPRTILVPPADIVSSSPVVPQMEKPLPTEISPDETPIPSSQSTPTDHRTSAVQSNETTFFTTPQEAPQASSQSSPTTPKTPPVPVQSTISFHTPAASPTISEKPPVTDAGNSSAKDASTRQKPSLSKDDYYKASSHTDKGAPHTEPTPPETSEMLGTFYGSSMATGHTRTSSVSAKEEPNQPSRSDFKIDSTATGIGSQGNESVPYAERTLRKPGTSDAATSKLHPSDVHHTRRAEQWHAATAGLKNLNEGADHAVPVQQVKPSKFVQQYPPQDSEQVTSHPVPQEPMSMEPDQGREKTTGRPYTDQRKDVFSPISQQTADARGIAEDKAVSHQRGVLLPPSTQEHGATPSMQTAAKDARAGYPGGQDTGMQPRYPGSVPSQTAAQDARDKFGESKAAESTIHSERSSDNFRYPHPRQDLDDAHHATAPFQTRHPRKEDTTKQAKDIISDPRQVTDQDTEHTIEETKIAESPSSRVQPLYFHRADAPSRKQETAADLHGATSPVQERHANIKDTAGQSMEVAFKPKQMIGQDDKDTSGDLSLRRKQPSDNQQAAATLTEQEANQGSAPPSQTRHPSASPLAKTIYPIAKDASKQPRGTVPTPRQKAAQDKESKTANGVASAEQPLDAWRAPITPRRQEVQDATGSNTPFQKRYPYIEDTQVADTAFPSRKIAPDGGKDTFEETKPSDSIPTSAQPMYTQRAALPPARQARGEDAQDKIRQNRVTIPEPQKMVARDAQDSHGERKIGTPGEEPSDHLQAISQSRRGAAKEAHGATARPRAQTRDDFSAEQPYKKETTGDQKLVPPQFSEETTSPVRPPSESLQEAVPHGELSTKPSTIDQWRRSSVPLNDVTTSSGDDEMGMPTIDQKLTPMSQQTNLSARGADKMARESAEQRLEPSIPMDAQTTGVRHAAPSFPGYSTFTTPDAHPAAAPTKRATPDGHEIGDSKHISTTDGQILEATKARHDPATVHEDVHDANLSTTDVAKDTFQETKVADSTRSSAQPMYTTQRPALTPSRHAEIEDAKDKGWKSSKAIPERPKMVERKTGTSGEQYSDGLNAIPLPRQAATEDAPGATGDTIRAPDTLRASRKSESTLEEAKGPGFPVPKAQSLGAHDAQRISGESTTPTAEQRSDVSTKPQSNVQEVFQQSKLSGPDQKALGSLSSEGKDAKDSEATMTEEKSFSTEQLREMLKESAPTKPKAQPTDSQGSNKVDTVSQKRPLAKQESQEQAQTIAAGEKANGSTLKHQHTSDAPYAFHEKLSASAPERAKTHDDFRAEPYRHDTPDDQKLAPPLLRKEPTYQVQPPSEPSKDAAPHGDLSSKPSTIDRWQRTSVPLHDVTTSSGDDEIGVPTIDQKLPLMSQHEALSAEDGNQMANESGERRVEPPLPIGADNFDVQRASSPFPGASVTDHVAIDDKFAKQSIADERVGDPMQMRETSPDVHPASAPTKGETPAGRELGGLEHVSTPGGQMLEATKAIDDPATVHEDVYDPNLSSHDVGKDKLKEAKAVDSTPSGAKPMHTEQPALTPSRQAEVEEARDKVGQSRETISERPKMVERKTGTSGEKAIHPAGQEATEDARSAAGDTVQSPDILDTIKKSRGTSAETEEPGSTIPKAQSLGAQDAQGTDGESRTPTADQRKDVSMKPQSNVQDVFQQFKLSDAGQKGLDSLPSEGKDAKDAETTMTGEKSFSTERLREMLKESESTTPNAQPTDSEGSSKAEKTFSVDQRPLAAEESQERAQVNPTGEKDVSTPKHQKASDAPYTFNEKSVTAPARADIRDDHSVTKPYKRYTDDDQEAAPHLLSKEPSSQEQPPSVPLQGAVLDGDLPNKSLTIDQWQRVSAPLHGVSTDSGDAEMTLSSNSDQKSIPMSQEATLSSQSVDQMATQSGEQRVDTPEPIGTEPSDVGRAVPSLSEAPSADRATIDDKFAKQSIVDELGEPKQMQAPITDAHPALPTKGETPAGHEVSDLELVSTPDGQTSEATKGIEDPATVHEDVYDANLSTQHASGDEHVTGSLHDQLAQPPASTQAQPTAETPRDSASSHYGHTNDALGETELVKPTKTDQEAMAPIAGPTSMETQLGGTLPAEVAHSEQKTAPSDQESTRTAPPSPVEPVKVDSNVSAADFTNAPQTVFRQQARPSAPITRGTPASDTQGVVRKIYEVTPDNQQTDDSGKPLVPSQEQVSHAPQAISGQEDMKSQTGAEDSPTSDTQLASTKGHEITPDDYHADEPLVSSRKQSSLVGSTFGPDEMGSAEKRFARSDQDLANSAEQPSSGEPRKEQIDVPTAEQKALPTVLGQQGTPDTREALTSEDAHDNIPTSSIEPARRPLSVQGEEPTSAPEASQPRVAFENAYSMKPSTTPDAFGITTGEIALSVPKPIPSGQDSPDPAQPPSSSGARNKEIRDSAPSAQLISSTEPRKGDAIVPAPDQAKDSQTTPGQQDILSAQRLLGKAQKDVPADESGKAKPSQPPSSVREGNPPTVIPTSAFAPSGQGSAYPAQSPSSGEPGSKEIRDLAPSTQLDSTNELRNGDASAAAPDKGKVNDDEAADDSGEAKTSKLPSVVRDGRTSAKVPASAPETEHGAAGDQAAIDEPKFAPSGQGSADTAFPASAPDRQIGPSLDQQAVDQQKFASSGQDSVHSVQLPLSTGATTEDGVVAATPAPDKSKTPFSGTDDDDSVDKLLPSEGHVSSDGHASEPHEGHTTDSQRTKVDENKTRSSSSQLISSEAGSDLTMARPDVRPSIGNNPTEPFSSGHEAQPPAATQDVLLDASVKGKSTDSEEIAPMDLSSVADTQQKFAAPDKESAHTSELASSAETRKEEPNAAATDQPNVSQDPQTTVGHQFNTLAPDARETLQNDHQPARDDDHISNLTDPLIASQEQTSSDVHSAVIDNKMALPSSEAQASDSGLDSRPIDSDARPRSGDAADTSYLQDQEAHPPVATQAPTTQSPRQPSSDQVMEPGTSSTTPSNAPQVTERGTDSVQHPQEVPFDFSSGEKTATVQGDPANTLPNGDLSTSQDVGRSERAVSKGANSQENLNGSTDEKSKMQQQIDQFGTRSSKDDNKEANEALRPNISATVEEPPKQPSQPMESMESSEEPESQQKVDQSLKGNSKQAEVTKAQDTGTNELEEREPTENTDQKNNKISQVKPLDPEKLASRVHLLGEKTKDASDSTDDTPGDIQKLDKSEDYLRSSEESKAELQTEGTTQGAGAEAPISESEQSKEGALPANSYQNNSSQSQEASDKSTEQSSPGIRNNNKNRRLDGSSNATESGTTEDKYP